MLVILFLIVPSERNNSSAISLLLKPFAIDSIIFISLCKNPYLSISLLLHFVYCPSFYLLPLDEPPYSLICCFYSFINYIMRTILKHISKSPILHSILNIFFIFESCRIITFILENCSLISLVPMTPSHSLFLYPSDNINFITFTKL